MAPTAVTVLYPKTNESKFDLDYYLSHHMPLVMEKLAQFGCKGYRVVKVLDEKNPYSIVATLEYDSPDQVQKSFGGEEGKEILGDVKNFSNVDPILLVGDVVGHEAPRKENKL